MEKYWAARQLSEIGVVEWREHTVIGRRFKGTLLLQIIVSDGGLSGEMLVVGPATTVGYGAKPTVMSMLPKNGTTGS